MEALLALGTASETMLLQLLSVVGIAQHHDAVTGTSKQVQTRTTL